MTVFRSIYFPVQLLVLHLRDRLVILLLWAILTAFSTGLVGRFFGMHYLMLTPEYSGGSQLLELLHYGGNIWRHGHDLAFDRLPALLQSFPVFSNALAPLSPNSTSTTTAWCR